MHILNCHNFLFFFFSLAISNLILTKLITVELGNSGLRIIIIQTCFWQNRDVHKIIHTNFENEKVVKWKEIIKEKDSQVISEFDGKHKFFQLWHWVGVKIRKICVLPDKSLLYYIWSIFEKSFTHIKLYWLLHISISSKRVLQIL